MQQLMKSWVTYILPAGIFNTALNLVFLAVPVYMLVVHDRVLFSFSTATLVTLGTGIMISLAAVAALAYARDRILVQAGNQLVQQMIPRVVDALHRNAAALTPDGYDRGLEDLETLRDAVIQGRFFTFLDLPWMGVYLFVLYVMHPFTGLVALAAVLMAAFFQWLLRIFENRRRTLADVGNAVGRARVTIRAAQAQAAAGMGMASGIARQYRERYAGLLKIKSEAEQVHAGMGAVIRFVHWGGIAGVFTAGTMAFFEEEITVGTMFAAVMVTVRLMMPLERHLSDMAAAIDAAGAYKRLRQFIGPDPVGQKTVLPEPAGQIQVQGLTLSIPGRTLVHGISLDLAPGQTLGVTGPNDAGKTVLCRLLSGIWAPASGEIRLDGALIDQWPARELGRYIGYMPQEPDLLPGTVAENIARFTGGGSDAVIQAARAAGAHDMILKLPQGYDTPILQAGTRLSAGRRQLISLARALYGSPRFLIMDEPHTYLDDTGLKILQGVIHSLKQQKTTTVIVTDRPAMLSSADKLLVIKEGRTAMYGAANEVMAQLAARQQPQQQAAGA
ncbi:MAG: ATP-binding cassette domain-containing protein [Desulfotignum sp.]